MAPPSQPPRVPGKFVVDDGSGAAVPNLTWVYILGAVVFLSGLWGIYVWFWNRRSEKKGEENATKASERLEDAVARSIELTNILVDRFPSLPAPAQLRPLAFSPPPAPSSPRLVPLPLSPASSPTLSPLVLPANDAAPF